MEVRLADVEDSEAIREIYNQVVTTSTATTDIVPRTPSEQRAWLAARAGAHVVVVAVDDGEVVGFASLSPYRDRPAYATTVEDSVYVRDDRHGRGVGRALLGRVVELATVHGFHAVMARIQDGHDASIGLHTAVGFEVVGTEREVARKFGRWLDVVVMQRLLNVPG